MNVTFLTNDQSLNNNSLILQFDAPLVIDSGQAKICTSWENVNKQMQCNTKLHMNVFQMT